MPDHTTSSVMFLPGDPTLAAFGSRFLAIPHWINFDETLSLEMRYLYGLLVSYVRLSYDNDREVTPGRLRLAEECKSSPESVSRWLKHLRSRGWVSWRQRGRGETAVYYVFGHAPGTDHGLGLGVDPAMIPEIKTGQNDNSRLVKMTTKQEVTSSPTVEDEQENRASVPEPRTTTARKSKISPAWRPDRNLAAHVLERTGWTQARLDAEIVKFVGWHESHATRHTNWGTAFARTWVSKALEIDGEREKRTDAGSWKPGDLIL